MKGKCTCCKTELKGLKRIYCDRICRYKHYRAYSIPENYVEPPPKVKAKKWITKLHSPEGFMKRKGIS